MEDSELLKAIAQIVQAETKPINERLDGVDRRLDGMNKRLNSMDGRLEAVEDRIGGMENELADVKGRATHVEADTSRMKLLMEHDIPKQINILAEGHVAIIERLPEADELDGIRSRVRALEHVVTEHTDEIATLKRAAN